MYYYLILNHIDSSTCTQTEINSATSTLDIEGRTVLDTDNNTVDFNSDPISNDGDLTTNIDIYTNLTNTELPTTSNISNSELDSTERFVDTNDCPNDTHNQSDCIGSPSSTYTIIAADCDIGKLIHNGVNVSLVGSKNIKF